MGREYTVEEVVEAYERNENFYGTRANFGKLKLYYELKDALTELMDSCEEVLDVDGFDPNIREKNATLWIDLPSVTILDREETAVLASVMGKADRTVIATQDGIVRITFGIDQIWAE